VDAVGRKTRRVDRGSLGVAAAAGIAVIVGVMCVVVGAAAVIVMTAGHMRVFGIMMMFARHGGSPLNF
jgi:hypothetical protein